MFHDLSFFMENTNSEIRLSGQYTFDDAQLYCSEWRDKHNLKLQNRQVHKQQLEPDSLVLMNLLSKPLAFQYTDKTEKIEIC